MAKVKFSALSDSALVEATRRGESGAFAELWNRHVAAGRTVATSFTSFEADDVVAEAFARILQAITGGGGPTGAFRPYLFTTIRNTASEWGRARREVPVDEAEDFADPKLIDESSLTAFDLSLTMSAWETLPPAWQEALWYAEVEQMSPRQAAPLLGIKPSAVASLTYRAREGLRQAWIQAHIASSAPESEHSWTLERLGSYSRHGLGKRETARVREHLEGCAQCSLVAVEARELSSAIAAILVPFLVGTAAATAYAASLLSRAPTQVAALGTAGAAGATLSSGSSSGGGGGAAAGAAGGAAGGGTAVAGTTGVIAFVVVGALVAAGAAAAVVVQQLATSGDNKPSTTASAPNSTPDPAAAPVPQATTPTPTSTPVPTPTDPFVPPILVPSPDLVSTPVSTPVPPGVPVVASPVSGVVTGALSLPFSGTGDPGSTVTIALQPAGTVLGSATVSKSGSWTASADLSDLPSGTYSVLVAESKNGLGSSTVQRTFTIDRPSAPTVALDLGELGTDLPIASGTAEPNATVTVSNGAQPAVSVEADDSGAWSTPQLTGFAVGSGSVTATQTDSSGATSVASVPVAFVLTAPAATVTSNGTGFTVVITGNGGAQAEVLVGVSASSLESLGIVTIPPASGSGSFSWSWPSGTYTLEVRYSDGKRYGPSVGAAFTIPDAEPGPEPVIDY
jgi:RNA polymerase sigma factor (sigma-70 family)